MRIYGTLGPSCRDAETIRQMFLAGMTGIRVNLSHTTLEAAADSIRMIRAEAQQLGIVPDILIDMQGPELRIGSLPAPLTLEPGGEVLLGEGGIPVQALVLPALQPGQEVLLDDGRIALAVTENRGRAACAAVRNGGTLLSRKSLALPGVELDPPAVTESDRANLRLAPSLGVTGLMQPFVRSRKDLEEVRAALREAGAEQVRILAKIENLQGIKHLPELIPACDEIIIARGDLGNAMPLWELPAAQKRIAAACRAAGRDFMVVTQMLKSMETCPVPTRAEVSDIFNAVLDGAASVMVTGETASGQYPAEVMRYLVNTVHGAEQYLQTR